MLLRLAVHLRPCEEGIQAWVPDVPGCEVVAINRDQAVEACQKRLRAEVARKQLAGEELPRAEPVSDHWRSFGPNVEWRLVDVTIKPRLKKEPCRS